MAAPTTCLPTAHCEPLAALPAPTAPSATPQATQHMTAHRSQLTPGQTRIASCTTVGALVFVAQGAPTAMSTPTATEATPGVPALRLHPMSPRMHHTHPYDSRFFARFLTPYPDSNFVSKLIHSLTNGFDIGYHGPRTHLIVPNLTGTSVVDEALRKEVAENRMAGPFNTTLPHTATSAVLALVLSQRRMEAGDSSTTSLPLWITASTTSLTQGLLPAVRNHRRRHQDMPFTWPKGPMAKVDLKNAFRLCPIRHEDWHLLEDHQEGGTSRGKCG